METPVQTLHVHKEHARWLMKVMSASVQRVGMEVIVNTVSRHALFFHKYLSDLLVLETHNKIISIFFFFFYYVSFLHMQVLPGNR